MDCGGKFALWGWVQRIEMVSGLEVVVALVCSKDGVIGFRTRKG